MSAQVRNIKKYPNRRLYDTVNSGYITLVDVKQMVLENIDFQVVDAKTGDDLTRAILLQIILEEESGGVPMFSTGGKGSGVCASASTTRAKLCGPI